ncbi:MAG: N-acetyltransferase [Comamonadaceae bacterium]|nr:MAG: N-acetyltransferase [Comamonadaceae bacterium]
MRADNCLDGHGPEWAAAVAALALRAADACGCGESQQCLTVLDLQPWRKIDAWWLRSQLEPLARHRGLAIRYVPCGFDAGLTGMDATRTAATSWSTGLAGDMPVHLSWPGTGSLPLCVMSGKPWRPDGPLLVLAGDLAQQMPQDMLLSHHGVLQEWRADPGEPRKWHPLPAGRYPDWVSDSLLGYTKGLPSAMLSLPVGYWQFLEQAFAWASHGAIVLTRAEGWSSLAQLRDEQASGAQVHEDAPPVNFHWLARQAHRLGASPQTIRSSRTDALQMLVTGLPEDTGLFSLLGAPLEAATRASRTDRARVVRMLALAGDLQGALTVLFSRADDPLMLRMAWQPLAQAARDAAPSLRTQLGAWAERLMADNPWIGEDGTLLRGIGHVAEACWQPDLARIALGALHEAGWALPSDDVVLAQALEQLGQLDAALAASQRAAVRQPGHAEAEALHARIASRRSALAGPWRQQHGCVGSPLLLDPLHEDHAAALAHQLRDPSICFMTVLPVIAQGDDGREWIKARLADAPAAYAVMHGHFGFVGCVSINLWETTGFISYWIGADYQGMGLAAPMLDLALDLAWRNGVELLLSSVYDDNERSLRVLRRGGFETMDVRALAPDTDRTFVMRPSPACAGMPAGEARERLFAFCRNAAPGLRFDPVEPDAPDALAATETSRNSS